jgi:hypothetical protein
MQYDQVGLIFNKEKQMATKKRIYAVTNTATPDEDGNCPTRLVRATTKSQALSYAARQDYVASVASQEMLVACLTDGVEVEDAGDEEATDGIPE